jgi:hypothetical protein
MKTGNRFLLIISILILVLLVLSFVFSRVDYFLAKNHKQTLFTFSNENIKDGGTIVATGLFYQIIIWHRFPPPSVSIDEYLIGTEIRYPNNWYSTYFSKNTDPFIKLEHSLKINE